MFSIYSGTKARISEGYRCWRVVRETDGDVVIDYIYPVIFEHDEEDDPDVWSATFPHWQPHSTAVTGGDSLSQAMFMAADLLSGMIMWAIRDGEELPKPTPLHELNVVPTANRFACIVSSKIAGRNPSNGPLAST